MVMGGGIWASASPAGPPNAASRTPQHALCSPDFFATLSIPLVRGRDVRDTGTMTTQMVAVVSQSFGAAVLSWRGSDRPHLRAGVRRSHDRRRRRGHSLRGLERTSEPRSTCRTGSSLTIRFRFTCPRISSSGHRRRSINSWRPSAASSRGRSRAALSNLRPMTDIVDANGARSVQVRVWADSPCVAFLLAAIGIHGLLSFAVSSGPPRSACAWRLGRSAATSSRWC